MANQLLYSSWICNNSFNYKNIIMANKLEIIRQNIIADTSYFSNMYATIDFLLDAIDKNDLKEAKALVYEIQNDVRSLGKDNRKVQSKLIDLINKNNYGK